MASSWRELGNTSALKWLIRLSCDSIMNPKRLRESCWWKVCVRAELECVAPQNSIRPQKTVRTPSAALQGQQTCTGDRCTSGISWVCSVYMATLVVIWCFCFFFFFPFFKKKTTPPHLQGANTELVQSELSWNSQYFGKQQSHMCI